MKDDFGVDIEQYTETDPYTFKEWVWLISAIIFLMIEISTMWSWCQWFTNCPKS
jgi:polyferredoxin